MYWEFMIKIGNYFITAKGAHQLDCAGAIAEFFNFFFIVSSLCE